MIFKLQTPITSCKCMRSRRECTVRAVSLQSTVLHVGKVHRSRSQCDAPCGIGLQPCSHGVLSVQVNIFLLLEFDTAT